MAARPNKSARLNLLRQGSSVPALFGLATENRTPRGRIDYAKLSNSDYEAWNELDRVAGLRRKSSKHPTRYRDAAALIRDRQIPLRLRISLADDLASLLRKTVENSRTFPQIAEVFRDKDLESEVVRHLLGSYSLSGYLTTFEFQCALRGIAEDQRHDLETRQLAYAILWGIYGWLSDADRLPLLRWLLRDDFTSTLVSPICHRLPWHINKWRLSHGSFDEQRVATEWLKARKGHSLVRGLVALRLSLLLDEDSLVEIFMDIVLQSVAEGQFDSIREDAHVWLGNTARRCWKRMVQDEFLPIDLRVKLAPEVHGNDVRCLLQLARSPLLTPRSRTDLADRILTALVGTSPHEPDPLSAYLCELAREDSAAWREIIYSDRIASFDPQILSDLMIAPGTTPLLAVLAGLRYLDCGSRAARDNDFPERFTRVLRAKPITSDVRAAILDRVSARDPVLTACCRIALAGCRDLDLFERAAHLSIKRGSRLYPAQTRAVLQALWHLAMTVEEPQLRLQAIKTMQDDLSQRGMSDFIGMWRQAEEDLQRYPHDLRCRQVAEAVRERIQGIDQFIEDSWGRVSLLEAAITPRNSLAVRTVALRNLRSSWNSGSSSEISQILPIARREKDGLLRMAAQDFLGRHFREELLSLMNNEPESPLWDCLEALHQFPDDGTAASFIRYVRPPSGPEEGWQRWLKERIPDVPIVAALPIFALLQRDAASFNRVFRGVRRSATRTNELNRLILHFAFQHAHSFTKEPDIWFGEALREILGAPHASSTTVEEDREFSVEVIGKLRCLQVATSLRERLEDYEQQQKRRSGLPRRRHSDPPSAPDTRPMKTPDEICARFAPYLVHAQPSQIGTVTQKTLAPLILAAHYLAVHPKGVPLLGKAIAAASGGTATWKEFRYASAEARKQIGFLSSTDRQQWQENLISVDQRVVETNTSAQIADNLRACFRDALLSGAFAPEIASLVPLEGEVLASLEGYRILQREIGSIVKGERDSLDGVDLGELPAEVVRQAQELATSPSRDNLFAFSKRLRAASDLLRLVHLDGAALFGNGLLAEGEDRGDGDGNNRPRLIARLRQLEHLLKNPHARAARSAESEASDRLEETFQTARSLLQQVGDFASRSSLVVEECDDFQTLIEIGHNPYGQGSCQDYMSSGAYNSCLLAYVVDAMTKAIVVRRAGTSGTEGLLARAIARVGQPRDGGPPIILLESVYPPNSTEKYGRILTEGARAFARKRGWRLGYADVYRRSSVEVQRYPVEVRIAASRNGKQYEDGHLAMAETPDNTPKGAYTLRVRLDSTVTPEHADTRQQTSESR